MEGKTYIQETFFEVPVEVRKEAKSPSPRRIKRATVGQDSFLNNASKQTKTKAKKICLEDRLLRVLVDIEPDAVVEIRHQVGVSIGDLLEYLYEGDAPKNMTDHLGRICSDIPDWPYITPEVREKLMEILKPYRVIF